MFGFSLTEVLLILAVALVVLGPEKIPDVARMLGKGLREVRKASNMMRDALMLDDPAPRPTPRPVAARAAETTNASLTEPMNWVPDPKPQRDIKMVACSKPRFTPDVRTVELTARKTVEPMREVYLHIPYDETI